MPGIEDKTNLHRCAESRGKEDYEGEDEDW